ncbi:MAG: hypothetical protein COV35_04200 [Alphaproteobacteria bacterium CG11_big_fil_rev_8_21_14_0_20_39_49]|nr:MAG: hypothetical protein COV35_04200 [Alphaproteobacteria bacterium CG11_big_fil_rev_8_21_14_0_20_39_49]
MADTLEKNNARKGFGDINADYDKITGQRVHLVDAAKQGSLTRVTELLSDGFNIDEKDSSGSTALIQASSRNDTNMVNFLLERKANPLVIDNEGLSAKDWASENGNKYIKDALMKAELNIRSKELKPTDTYSEMVSSSKGKSPSI